MDSTIGQLTVFFEDPFWVGVFERMENGKLSVCKVTFGAEPKNYDVYEFILKEYWHLRFSPPVAAGVKESRKNPKSQRREIARKLAQKGIGTKSQQALKLQQEQMKQSRQSTRRQNREEEKQRDFDLRQKKKKEKRRGR